MENVTRALIMAFSMLIFVIAFSYAMYLINKVTATSDVLLESITTSKYYDNIGIEVGSDLTTREVGIDTIIPVLYRYYKENYAVKIYDGDTLIQVFDVNLESKIARAAAYTGTTDEELYSLKKSIYNNNGNKFTTVNSATPAYLFEAPWTGNTNGEYEDTRARINYFLNGEKGYINNTLVDYSATGPAFGGRPGGFIGNYGDETTTFTESFVEYAYSGETISTENGLETITGNTQESNKIIITYTLKN